MKKSQNVLNIIGTVILGVLLIISMILQLANLNASTTKLETGLFNIINLMLSLGFSWLLTRIVTKAEFEESLKRFAISAYRRTTDTARSLDSLISQIVRMKLDLPEDRLNELNLLIVVAKNIQDTVTSSTDDWVNVIGEELRKKEELQELRERRSAALSEALDTNDREKELRDLEFKIDKLRSDLPYLLQEEDELPRAGRMSNRAWEYFVENIRTYGYLVLRILPHIEISEENINRLIVTKKYSFRQDHGAGTTYLYVEDIGQVDCDVLDGVYSQDYIFTLETLLAPISMPVGNENGYPDGFEIDGIEYAGVSEDKQYVFIKIPMAFNKVK